MGIIIRKSEENWTILKAIFNVCDFVVVNFVSKLIS
jgi:hypothetical protein